MNKKIIAAVLAASTISSLVAKAETVTQARIAAPKYSTYIGQGFNAAGAGQHNTAIGHSAMPTASSSFNTAVGSHALNKLSSGQFNTGVGLGALQNLTTGSMNTSMGQGSMVSAIGSSSNTAMGWSAMYSNTTGNNNVAIGKDAANYLTTGSNNVAIGGSVAGSSLTTGSNNIVIGASATLPSPTGSHQLNIGNLIRGIMTGTKSVTVDGSFAANSLSTAGGIAGASLKVTGLSTLGTITSGALTSSGTVTATGLNVTGASTLGAGATVTTGNLQVSAGNVSARIGNFSGGVTVGDIATFDKQLSLKEQAAPTTAAQAGRADLYLDQTSKKLVLRDTAGNSPILTTERAILGELKDVSSNDAHFNIYIGSNHKETDPSTALSSVYEYHNTALGHNSQSSVFRKTWNVVGERGTGNSSFGSHSLQKLQYGENNTAVGLAALQFVETGSNNTAIGNAALNVAKGSSNSALGNDSLLKLQQGADNVAFGASAAKNLTTGDQNIIIGSAAGYNLSKGGNNILIGSYAGFSNTPEKNLTFGSDNILIGTYVTTTNNNATNELNIGNLIKGQLADFNGIPKSVTIEGNLSTTGSLKVAGGSPAAGKVLTSDATGNATWQAAPTSTIADGSITSAKILDGTIGSADLADKSVTDAKIASVSASKLDFTNTPNTVIGSKALSKLSSGNTNIAIGQEAGSQLQSGSNNILIGNNVQIDVETTSNGETMPANNMLNIGDLITGYFGDDWKHVNIKGDLFVDTIQNRLLQTENAEIYQSLYAPNIKTMHLESTVNGTFLTTSNDNYMVTTSAQTLWEKYDAAYVVIYTDKQTAVDPVQINIDLSGLSHYSREVTLLLGEIRSTSNATLTTQGPAKLRLCQGSHTSVNGGRTFGNSNDPADCQMYSDFNVQFGKAYKLFKHGGNWSTINF